MIQQLNEEALIARGNRAEELLRNETFAEAFKDLIDYNLNAFITSRPEDAKTREIAYYQASAIQQITGLLQQWATIKEQIIAHNDSVEE